MKIYFTEENKREFFKYVDDIVNENQWSEGKYTKAFEHSCQDYFGMNTVSVSNAGSALYLLYKFIDVKGKDVIIPGNTFYATAAAAKMAGANIIYADCNKEDLCLSYNDVIKKVTPNTVAITVVHIGGHIAFDIEKIAQYCKENNIALVEDCAHAHGAEWNGKRAGSWGVGGAYSLYATKTLTTGEGGLIVTKDNELSEWCKIQRNYGKKIVDGRITYHQNDAFNFRISEFTAALGLIQMSNIENILKEKRDIAQKYDQIFPNHVEFPEGMKSGYYKYIVFGEKLKIQTGKVFDAYNQCYNIDSQITLLPNCQWVAENHSCPPIYCGIEYANCNCDEIKKILIDDGE